ncbi:MAG: CinA family protein [Candidatus Bipolaricaulis sp.]|nr:CinA family protein [Candidatus Bipolaricaulis sp.]MDD5220590.1 CinA family protein [Candidatus Bipolaricaulis sp.]MDD5646100.1 CinA family protein [Candidatus Bipolaricaulis sp.]
MRNPAEELAKELLARSWKLAVAESCTGGGLGARITATPGSSAYFLGGIIAYHNRVKRELLGVPEAVFAEAGAVSRPTAEAMAIGCLTRLGADVAVSITGIAGPGGGTPDKPVGLVYVAAATRHGVVSEERRISGTRAVVRREAALAALRLALAAVRGSTEAPQTAP